MISHSFSSPYVPLLPTSKAPGSCVVTKVSVPIQDARRTYGPCSAVPDLLVRFLHGMQEEAEAL